MAKSPTKKHALSDDSRKRLHKAGVDHARVSSTTLRRWCDGAAFYAAEVSAGRGMASASADGMLWIRVYDVLIEVKDVFEEHDATLVQLAQESGSSGILRTYSAWMKALLDAIRVVRTALTEDELLYLEYRRMVECHLFQTAYRVRRARDGSLIENRKSNLVGRALALDALEKALRRVLVRFRNENEIAANFASRLSKPLESLAMLVRAYVNPGTFAVGPSAVLGGRR